MKAIDKFEAPITFNFRGSGGLSTPVGGLLTLLIYIGYSFFFHSKLVLVGRERGDDITSYITPLTEDDFSDKGEILYKNSNLTFMFKLLYKEEVVSNPDDIRKFIELK